MRVPEGGYQPWVGIRVQAEVAQSAGGDGRLPCSGASGDHQQSALLTGGGSAQRRVNRLPGPVLVPDQGEPAVACHSGRETFQQLGGRPVACLEECSDLLRRGLVKAAAAETVREVRGRGPWQEVFLGEEGERAARLIPHRSAQHAGELRLSVVDDRRAADRQPQTLGKPMREVVDITAHLAAGVQGVPLPHAQHAGAARVLTGLRPLLQLQDHRCQVSGIFVLAQKQRVDPLSGPGQYVFEEQSQLSRARGVESFQQSGPAPLPAAALLRGGRPLVLGQVPVGAGVEEARLVDTLSGFGDCSGVDEHGTTYTSRDSIPTRGSRDGLGVRGVSVS